ncbi:hypothetical protein PRZ48_009598 [Zasmidium cellare]|uniref:DUF6923 domain-containing protein n=1 Tax=Zasmidium cellare TaxID=395010 RepID=A0ABR0ECU9_ZASCE|nr:hypothetical protein PRZ48_009598 [Zasmidium cellare]
MLKRLAGLCRDTVGYNASHILCWINWPDDHSGDEQRRSSTTVGTIVILQPLATLACAGYGYLAQQATLITVDLGSGSSSSTTNVNITSGSLDSIGFNQADNYLYGVNRGVSPQAVYRIGAAGATQFVLNLPAGVDFYAGDVDSTGLFFVAAPANVNGFYFAQINLSPSSSFYGRIQYQAYGVNGPDSDVVDWVATPGQTGVLLSVQVYPGGDTYLQQFDTTAREWATLTYYGLSVTDVTNPSFSALYGASDGYIYATEGNGGAIWRFAYQDPYDYRLVSRGPVAVGADGARCGSSSLAIQPALPQFACGTSGYLIQFYTLYRVSLTNGTVTPFLTLNSSRLYNAIGFNSRDNYIYGTMNGPTNNLPANIVRIASNGTVQIVVPNINNYWLLGDVDANGQYWTALQVPHIS